VEALRVASAAWELRPCRGEDDFWDHLYEFVSAADGCSLLVLPELVTLELESSLNFSDPADANHPPMERSSLLASSFACLQQEVDARGLALVMGSAFHRLSGGWINRSPILRPHRTEEWQDKQILTQFEAAEWGLLPGSPLRAMDWSEDELRLGTLICYDVEFPPFAMRLVEAGAEVLAVPSFTETWHGHHRVRFSCHARAIECQIFVLHSCLLGGLGRS
jgi:predicted amidohydrolase